MHAYLITGSAFEDRFEHIQKRLRELHIEQTDIVYLEDEHEHIGVGAVRAFGKRMILAPYQSPLLAGVLYHAERLTAEAQNALLKILEEPPPHVIFFVEVASPDTLLPTVVSRVVSEVVKKTSHEAAPDSSCRQIIEKLLDASPGNTLRIIETIARDRAAAKDWVQQALVVGQTMLHEKVKIASTKEIESLRLLLRFLLRAQGELELNMNPKLVLDTVFLSLHRSSLETTAPEASMR